jgi:Golgi nucleoside diphosphatase
MFPTASTVAVFLGGYHIDLAYQVQYKESADKIPIYGYSDYVYTKVAHGRKLVQGVLVVNFTFPGYLNAVLNGSVETPTVPRLYNSDIINKTPGAELNIKEKIKLSLRTELPPNGTSAERKARAEYIASLLKQNKDKATAKAALSNLYEEPENQKITDLVSPLSLKSNNLDMDVYYQDPSLQTWYLKFNNVHFNEVSQVISQAGAEGSSDPLYEVYSFIASDKTIKIVQ